MAAEFPMGGGEVGALIRKLDWCQHELGPIAQWPHTLRCLTSVMLLSPLPMVLLWGRRGLLIYNDGYAAVAGRRHPAILGEPALEAWPELADWNGRVLEAGFAGQALEFQNQELTLTRNGRPEEAWFDLNYTPVLNDECEPVGVFATVVETTRKVLAERALEQNRAEIEFVNRRLMAETEFLQQLFEDAPGFMAMLVGPEHRFHLANAAYRQLVGNRELIGEAVRAAFPEIEGQGFFELLDEVYTTARAIRRNGMRIWLRRGPDGAPQERIIDFIYQPVAGADGAVSGVFVEGQDVTDRAMAESNVRASEKRFRALVNATSDVIYQMSPDWRRMIQLDGRGVLADANAATEQWQEEYFLKEDLPAVRGEIDAAIREVRPFQLEHRMRRADGSTGWASSRAVPVLDGGKIMEWFGATTDVTVRKDAEEHLRLVVNELNHRVKNTLAIVQAIGTQSFRGAANLEQAETAFTGRIMALARANDLLTSEHWVGASVAEVVHSAMEPYCKAAPSRCEIAGSAIQLPAKAAFALSMALHELVTNALKYGAWSTPVGTVRISWRLKEDVGGPQFHLLWQEHGGPKVVAPSQRGFGSRLIERGLAAEMGGVARMYFEPEGVMCTLTAPLMPSANDSGTV